MAQRADAAPARATAPEAAPTPPPRADRCDGEDDDHDGTVDESCGCAAGLSQDYPPVPFSRIGRAVPTSDGALLLMGTYGVSRYDGRTFETLLTRLEVGIVHAWIEPARIVVLDVNGKLGEVRGGRRTALGNARLPLRSFETWGRDFEHALVLDGGALYRLSPTITKIAGLPEDIESFAGDARAFVAVQTDGTVHHGDGTTIRTTRLSGARPDDLYFRAANDVLSVGSDHRVSRFDGQTWTALRTITGERLELIAGEGALVFVHGHDLTTDEHTVHRFDGRTWTDARFPPDDAPYDIVVSGRTMYALRNGKLFVFDGHGYTVALDAFYGTFSDIHGHSARSIFVVGSDGEVMHYDGDRYTRIHHEDGVGLVDVHAARDDLAFAVGVRTQGSDRTSLALVCNTVGCAPFAQEAGPLGDLTAIWATSETAIVLGNRQGALHHFDGTRWTLRGPLDGPITQISGSSFDDLYATIATGDAQASPRGKVVHFDGTFWTQVPGARSGQDLEDVAVLTEGRILVGGGNEGYIETGSDLFVHAAGRATRIRVGDTRGAMSLAVLGEDFLSLGRTHIERDAGDEWGEDTWVLRLHQNGRTRAIARDAHHLGMRIFATSPTNVFVVGAERQIMHACGATPVSAWPTVR